MKEKLRSSLLQQADAAGPLGLAVALYQSGLRAHGIRLTRAQTAAPLRQLCHAGAIERIPHRLAGSHCIRYRITVAGRDRL